jgi:hypothetical protein
VPRAPGRATARPADEGVDAAPGADIDLLEVPGDVLEKAEEEEAEREDIPQRPHPAERSHALDRS